MNRRSFLAFGAAGTAGLFHATRGELLRALGRHEEARSAVRRALALATNAAERDLLQRRLLSLP